MEDQLNNQHFCNTDLMKIPASPDVTGGPQDFPRGCPGFRMAYPMVFW